MLFLIRETNTILEVINFYLCDIILDWLPLNHLQKVVVEKVLNHALLNKGN